MKLLLVTPVQPYPPTDGNRLRIYSLIRHLAPRHEIYVLCFNRNDMDYEGLEGLRKVVSGVFFVQAKHHVTRVQRVMAGLERRWNNSAFPQQTEMAQAIREALRSEKFDLVQFEHLHMAQYAPLARGIPRLVTLHNVEPARTALSGPGDRGHLTGATMTEIIRFQSRLGKFCEGIVTMSEVEHDMLENVLEPKVPIYVVPNGVDTIRYRPLPKKEEPGTLVFTGDMQYRPNVEAVEWFVKEMWPLVKAKHPQAAFRIVGKRPTPEVKALAGNGVVVTGEVPDIRDYIVQGQVYVAPLLTGGGTRLKLLEAMALARPIVTTAIGCEGLTMENGQHAIIADDTQSFAEGVIRLLGDAGERARLGQAARALAEAKFAWRSLAAQHEQVYADMLHKTVEEIVTKNPAPTSTVLSTVRASTSAAGSNGTAGAGEPRGTEPAGEREE